MCQGAASAWTGLKGRTPGCRRAWKVFCGELHLFFGETCGPAQPYRTGTYADGILVLPFCFLRRHFVPSQAAELRGAAGLLPAGEG